MIKHLCFIAVCSLVFLQVYRFLEFTYGLLAKLSIPSEEKSRVTEIVNTEIQKWLEILVDNVDMRAGDVIKYLNFLRQNLRPVQLNAKFKQTVHARVGYSQFCLFGIMYYVFI